MMRRHTVRLMALAIVILLRLLPRARARVHPILNLSVAVRLWVPARSIDLLPPVLFLLVNSAIALAIQALR